MRYQPVERTMQESYAGFSKKQKRIAYNRTITCIHARQAASEGWINFLFDHYRYEHSYPTDEKILWMKDAFRLQQEARKFPAAANFKHMFHKSDELRRSLIDSVNKRGS